VINISRILSRLSDQLEIEEHLLLGKSRTGSLDELRYQSGIIEGLQAAMRLIELEIRKVGEDGTEKET